MIRIRGTTYPTGTTVLTQGYTSGIDARLSRVSTLTFNSPNGTKYPLATYRRAGADLFAVASARS